jgi:sugar phosphate isomerase/epimerase
MELKIAFSTLACPEWNWHDLLANASAYGFDGIEVRLLRGETDLLQLDEFQATQLPARRAELAARGLRICGLSSSVRFDFDDAAVLACSPRYRTRPGASECGLKLSTGWGASASLPPGRRCGS